MVVRPRNEKFNSLIFREGGDLGCRLACKEFLPFDLVAFPELRELTGSGE